jgi:hypothetical protein
VNFANDIIRDRGAKIFVFTQQVGEFVARENSVCIHVEFLEQSGDLHTRTVVIKCVHRRLDMFGVHEAIFIRKSLEHRLTARVPVIMIAMGGLAAIITTIAAMIVVALAVVVTAAVPATAASFSDVLYLRRNLCR